MINSRDVAELHPIVEEKCLLLIQKCKEVGIDIIVTSTYRDAESQNALYAIGRTVKGSNISAKKPMGSVVTNAKAGYSFHNFRVAFDIVPVVNGKAVWSDNNLWKKIGEIGTSEDVGLEWAGNWKTFKEFPHFQYTNGLSLADFRAGKTL
jgi:peptidoglycan L-alanyl-D-glutamate endopeptidase CwlK